MRKLKTRLFTGLLAVMLCCTAKTPAAFANAEDPEEGTSEKPVTGGVEPEPLTPEGNAALVDDFGGNKQLITVTTKSGNYFYILIDRANEDKETAVHFLNQVDEADLMALMEDGQSAEKPPAVCNCTEKCEAGAVNTKCEVCSTDMTGCTGKEPEPPKEPTKPEKKEPAGLNPAVLLLVLAVMGGAAFAYFKFIKGKANHKNSSNPDDYDYEDGEELPDEEETELEDEESGELDADRGGGEESEDDTP